MAQQKVVETLTQDLGRQLHARILGYRMSPAERVQEWLFVQLAKDPSLRNRLLRFIDVLAALDFDRRGEYVKRLFREYFPGPFRHMPWALSMVFAIGRSPAVPSWVLASTARWATRATASRFIAGHAEEGVEHTLAYLERHGRLPSFDILGEQVLSRAEADQYRMWYLRLLEKLGLHPWSKMHTRGNVPRLQVSIKLSSLTHDFNPTDPKGTLLRVRGPLEEVLQKAAACGVGVTIDAEEYEHRELAWHVVSQLLAPSAPCGSLDGVGVVVQAYQTDAEAYLQEVLRFAERRHVPFQVRLVKGAYWDYEVIQAHQFGWPVPVFQEKADTDQTYEKLLRMLLENSNIVRVAVASHNVRTHAYAEALREAMGLAPGALEHQTLFRTAEGLSRAIQQMGWEQRDYVPVGELLPGMAYLVRRVLENTSQVGFLTQSRIGGDVDDLLQPPAPKGAFSEPVHSINDRPNGFYNNPPKRLFIAEERAPFEQALARIKQQGGQEYPLDLGGEQVRTNAVVPSLGPSDPDPHRPLGLVHQAGVAEAERAIALARQGFAKWSQTPPAERARILLYAADLMRQHRDDLAAWVVYEGGRNWSNALGDVDEAIDHLDYNARNLLALAPRLEAEFRPWGVVAAIPPWNFPAALPMGMTSAALATGNAVILKSAGPTPIVAQKLVNTLYEAGVPHDVLIHLPGPGGTIGSYLVASPNVDMVAFTGSKAVGKDIYQRASQAHVPGGLKKVIAELGGKNAIIVFPDADIDEAVRGILISTFEHANQKCSACSRVFAHRSIYLRLRNRLKEATLDLSVGLADDPGTVVNPLINQEAKDHILAFAQRARAEGNVLVDRLQQDSSCPLLVGPMIVELQPSQLESSVIAKEEIFGPILTLVPYDNEERMVAEVNSTVYAQTAGIFSRSPQTIARMVRQVQAGTIYVNRVITGARVGIEPFGGYRLSGTGPKTGSPEYLFGFVMRRAILANSQSLSGSPTVPSLPNLAIQVQPWQAETMAQRRFRLEACLHLLRHERWPELLAVLRNGTELSVADAAAKGKEATDTVKSILEVAPEIAEPQPTITIPGQKNFVLWQTPRGKGIVATRQSTSPALFLGMVFGPLLAGNGLLLAPDARHRPLAELLLRTMKHAGVPPNVVRLSSQRGSDALMALANDLFHFAVTDLDLEATQHVYECLGVTREEEGQWWLKALISMDHDLRPGETGFLRQFAIAKTVSIRTLRHGADLELTEG